MKKGILLVIAFLCTFAQGVRADKWDGHTLKEPPYLYSISYPVCYKVFKNFFIFVGRIENNSQITLK